MKKIIFVRHGKAEEEQGFSDFERSLTAAGKKISRQIAITFREKEKSPGLFISSPAFRAIETALIFAAEFGNSYDKVALDNRLYFKTNLDRLLDILTELDEKVNTITIFGHNPSFTEMADRLSANGCNLLPKSGVFGLSFNATTWSDIKPGTGKLEYFLKPEK